MSMLAKPLKLSFELNPDKAQKFFENSDRSAFEKVVVRASKHQPKTNSGK